MRRLLLTSVLVAWGCQDAGVQPSKDAAIDADLGCDADADDCGPCVPGLVGCECVDDVCAEGLACVDRLCAECTPDIVGCPCESGECGAELVCDPADERCRPPLTCAVCSDRQICMPGDAETDAHCLPECEDGFIWDPVAAVCVAEEPVTCADVEASCAARLRGCVESASGPVCGACVEGATDEAGGLDDCRLLRDCAAAGCAALGRVCTAPPAGEDARCGVCEDGLIEEAGRCVREPARLSCAPGAPNSLLAACRAEQRSCVEGPDGAACGDCLAGYVEDGDLCAPRCDAAACAAEGRTCPGLLPDTCGPCRDGFVQIAGTDRCEPVACDPLQCQAIGRRCGDAGCGACIMGEDDGTGTCRIEAICPAPEVPLPDGQARGTCLGGQAIRCQSGPDGRHVAERCVDCRVGCDIGPGLTGDTAPFTLVDSDRCLCAVEGGYYFDAAVDALAARPCDADGDGWTRLSARRSIGPDANPALRAIARCDLQQIDRVILRNEYAQEMTIYACDGPEIWYTQPCRALNLTPRLLPLYEPAVLDDLDLLEQLGAAPVFSANGMGRELKPNELNPLTKACADADANANGVEDYLEHQTMPLEGVDPDLVPFTALAYFVELHHGFFSPVPINQACDANGSCGDVTLACNAATNQCERLGGAWVIEERSRCAPDAFPLQYPPADDYWRACVRNRRMSFDADASQLGHDFARFSCAESTGQCAPQAPVPLDPPATPVTCDDRVTAAAFMGMHHHSQFQCVQFVSADDVVDRAFQRPLTAADGPQPSLNRCRVVCPANDENCVDDCDPVDGCAASALGEAGQPAEPILECAIAAELALGDIGFVATPYTTAANGVAPEGCINEWFPAPETGPHADIVDTWRRRCTGFRVDPQPIFGSGSPAAFGELRCGCGLNNGGTDCEIGCPNLLGARYGGTGDPAECPDNGYCTTPRAGFWLCGSVGGPTDLPPSDDAQAWRLRAPSHPTAMGTLCEGGPCPSPDQPAMGWRLHPGE